MSKQIDRVKREKYKQARIKGKSICQSLKDAGYAKTSAEHHNSELTVVKRVENEIMNELKSKDITVDWVINELAKELTAPDAKASDRVRVKELLGKYIHMFTDSQPLVSIDISDTLSKLREPAVCKDAQDIHLEQQQAQITN